MKKLLYIMGVLLTMAACSNIGEDERFIQIERPTPVDNDSTVSPVEMRRVLIEDFTGQRCVNCPAAADEIVRLQQAYGHDAVIAVGIHGGSLAFWGNASNVGLRTELGDEYNNYWDVKAWPLGLINRKGGLANVDQWFTLVNTAVQQTAPLRLQAEASCDASTRQLTVTVNAEAQEPVSGKLQLWLTESNITAMQSMPDGTVNRDYVHNHVLRTAINGTWGDDFVAETGQLHAHTYTATLDASWQLENLAVVAFVYDDSGVLQVTETELLIK